MNIIIFCFRFRNPYLPMDFQAFQDPMACQECLASRGHKDRWEEMELKDRLVIRARKEYWDQSERKEMKDLVERADRQE